MPTLTANRTVPSSGSTVPGMPTPMAFTSLTEIVGGSGHIERRLQRSRDDTFGAAVCRKHDRGDHVGRARR